RRRLGNWRLFDRGRGCRIRSRMARGASQQPQSKKGNPATHKENLSPGDFGPQRGDGSRLPEALLGGNIGNDVEPESKEKIPPRLDVTPWKMLSLDGESWFQLVFRGEKWVPSC